MRLAIIAALALAGCSHTEPGIEVRTVEVIKPVPVACIGQADVPAPVPPIEALPNDARQAADLLAATVLQLRAVDRELRALLSGCIR